MSANIEGKHHVGRLVATNNPSCEDSVAYLSPILAFNLGIQQDLEAYMAQAPRHPREDSLTSPDQNPEEGNDVEEQSDTEGKGSQQRVQITHLSEPVSKEGFGVMLQPGKLQTFASAQCWES